MVVLRNAALIGALLTTALSLTACDQTDDAADESAAPDPVPSQAATADTEEDISLGADTGPFRVRQGMIQYSVSGLQDGTETLYWKNYGLNQAVYGKITRENMGVQQEQRTWQIMTTDTVTSIDLDANSATRMPKSTADFAEQLSAQQERDLGKRLLDQLVLRGNTETILGLECEVIRLQGLGGDTCLWQGLVLRGSSVGRKDLIATQIDLESPVDASHFTVPADMPVTSVSLAPGALGQN